MVTTTASVVTAVYGKAMSDFRGFVIQTPGTGGSTENLRTGSNAIFVYLGSTAFDVKIGDVVKVSGTAGEYGGGEGEDSLTQIGGQVTITELNVRVAAPRPVTGQRWASTVERRENLESMLYRSNEKFVVADTYPLSRFGALELSAGRLRSSPPTSVRPAAHRPPSKPRSTTPPGSSSTTVRTVATPRPRPCRVGSCRT